MLEYGPDLEFMNCRSQVGVRTCASLQPDMKSSASFHPGETFIFIFPAFSGMQKPRISGVERHLYRKSAAISATLLGRIIWCKDRANETRRPEGSQRCFQCTYKRRRENGGGVHLCQCPFVTSCWGSSRADLSGEYSVAHTRASGGLAHDQGTVWHRLVRYRDPEDSGQSTQCEAKTQHSDGWWGGWREWAWPNGKTPFIQSQAELGCNLCSESFLLWKPR